jgi:hypothetical protein
VERVLASCVGWRGSSSSTASSRKHGTDTHFNPPSPPSALPPFTHTFLTHAHPSPRYLKRAMEQTAAPLMRSGATFALGTHNRTHNIHACATGWDHLHSAHTCTHVHARRLYSPLCGGHADHQVPCLHRRRAAGVHTPHHTHPVKLTPTLLVTPSSHELSLQYTKQGKSRANSAQHDPTLMIPLQQMSGKDADSTVQNWMLHTLWMAVDAGGLSFASYTHRTPPPPPPLQQCFNTAQPSHFTGATHSSVLSAGMLSPLWPW